MRLAVFILLSVLCFACDKQSETTTKPVSDPLFVRLSSEETGVSFVNEVENQKNFNIFKYRNFYNGGGVAIGDINNDGLPDIFFTANMQKDKLFLNKGNFKFEDITDRAGVGGNKPWSTGVVMADVNGDGFLDIYVSNAGNMEGNNHDNDLYINNGDLTFTESAAKYNLAKSGFSTHASFFDYDKDGDLDAYLLNNSNIPVSSLGYAADRDKRASDWENVPEIFRGVGDVLLENVNGRFEDVSEKAGIYGSLIGFGLGVMVSDVNDDTWPDIYITNDFYERDYLYINQKNGTFSEEIKNWTSHLCLSAMGVDIADINNDGLKDIYITDMMPETDKRTKAVMEFETYDVFKLKQSRDFYQQFIQNTLQINNGNNSFSEIAYFSGVAKTDWSWAGLIFDMDNDGLKDIYVTNGIIHDLTDIDFVDFLANEVIRNTVLTGEKKEVSSIINTMPSTPLPNYAFRNNGNLKFDNATEEWGLKIPSFSNGCAYGDLDNDGDLDIVVNNVNMECFVFRNESQKLRKNNYLQFQLKGEKVNTFALGSVVKLYFKDATMVQELMPSRGFQSSMDYVLTFGLGERTLIDSAVVTWPDDRVTILKDIKANQRITLAQADGKSAPAKTNPKKSDRTTLFTELKSSNLDAHVEDAFDDFDQEGLIVKYVSKEGPALAVGDVNKDGNEDIFVGGAKGQPGKLYMHTSGGKLNELPSQCFKDDERFEDTAAEFFDADGDGDLDLAVGSGGNNISEKENYRTRLYLNNGSGAFQRAPGELPFSKSNVSVIKASDVDADGDIDLFVGGRSVPGLYGVNPVHLILINNGDATFTDATERYAYDIRNAGMVTDATWADIDGDKKLDLITVAEWGAPMILRNSGRRLSKSKTTLDSLHGWWKVVEAEDIDADGDVDLMLGNAGLNIPYPGTPESPMKMWVNDFDANGTIEQIMTKHENGKDFPIHMRKEITGQMPTLKKENLKASDYARRTIQEIFQPDVVQNSVVRQSNFSESIVAINEGSGKFRIVTLPDRVQWSCVCGIFCTDVNNDGATDLVMGGNFYDYKPQFSRQDASYGNVLLGDGKNNFKWESYNNTGIFIRDEVRHLETFADKNGKRYVFAAVNNSAPRVYKFNADQK